MSFNDIKRKMVEDQPEKNDLLCTHPGCKNLWSVKIDAPLCSFHQWGPKAKPKAAAKPDEAPKQPRRLSEFLPR